MSDNLNKYETALAVCGTRHCRIVLAALLEEQGALTLRELTNEIVKLDPAISGEDSTDIFHSLHHTHCPKLAGMGVVQYDQTRHQIELTETFDRFEPYLSSILEIDPVLDI